MRQDPLSIPLYHITHIDNLPAIIESGGLWCDRARIEKGLNPINIAYQGLKERRMRAPVPLYPCKTLGDFVPFYFTNRSPMLYAIHTGFVEGYSGGQDAVVYLVTSIGELSACGRNWCFTDGHAVEAFTEFYNNIEELDKIDWDVIDDWSWHNTMEDNDRKRRKQAEFLVEEFVPIDSFSRIAVMNVTMKDNVTKLLAGLDSDFTVSCEPGLFY